MTSPNGLLSDIPTNILVSVLAIEAVYPTLGDDDDCTMIAHPASVEPMRPDYAGDPVLDAPVQMPPDDLCLYHCLVAAADYVIYLGLTVSEREAKAEQLRSATIALLQQHGPVSYTHLRAHET